MRTVLSLLLIVRLVTLLLASAFAAPPHAQNLALQREGTHLYLTAKGARLALNVLTDALDTPIATVFTLPSGDTVTLYSQASPYPPQPQTAVVSVRTKAGQISEISLDATLKQWLPDDSKWNEHTFGNYLRGVYNHEGLSVSLENPVLFQGALLAVLTTRSVRGSGNVIKSQQLVRVVTAPAPGLQMLRFLDVPYGHVYSMSRHIPRLFVWGKRLLLFPTPFQPEEAASILKSKSVPQSELHEIDLMGRTLRTVGSFPSPYFPLGIVANRWLVLGLTKNVAAHPVWMCDLKSQRSAALAGNWKAYNDFELLRLPPPGSTMPYLALEGETVPVIHLPSGKRGVVLPGSRYADSVLLWDGLVVITDREKHRVTAYDVRTGRRIKSFAL
jgi:hypothetical protein